MKVLLTTTNYIKTYPKFVSFKSRETLEQQQYSSELKNLEQRLRISQMLLGKKSINLSPKDKTSLLEYQIMDIIQQISFINDLLDSKEQCDKTGGEDLAIFGKFWSAEDINRMEKEALTLINEANRTLGLEPLKKDLIVTPAKTKKAKPFELSDKLLILDEYQQKAVEEFQKGNTVLVTAPTGTGKTLIAEHIIDDILKSGKKVIYTTPLKALCNDKYKQFSALWGDYNEKGELIGNSNVGLATGDVKINVNAPIVVMTTEIYRNMLVQQNEKSVEKELKNVDAVIFDEFHYMGDEQRGSVWEESVMFSPKRMKFLMLSATISNAQPLKDWFSEINDDHKSTVINVPEEERHVPLKHYIYTRVNGTTGIYDLIDNTISINNLKDTPLSKRQREILEEIKQKLGGKNGLDTLETIFYSIDGHPQKLNAKTFIKELIKLGIPYAKAAQYSLILSDKKLQKINSTINNAEGIAHPPLKELILELERNKMTPALYFTYSKRNCKNLMEEASKQVGSLLTLNERQEIASGIAKIQKRGIFLGTDFEKDIQPCLMKGFAMHHSGMLPQCKSFIEELGRRKLIKVCFATDTLGAGINFPFKTVVFSNFEKYTEDGFEEISTNAFKQGAGRAGRRGIDDIGYVISIPKEREAVVSHFNKATQPSDEIQSSFSLTYGLILSPRFLNSSIKVLNTSFDNFQKKSYDEQLRKSMKMLDILKERKIVERKNNKYQITPKGKISAKVRGINEILLAEILTNTSFMENITPEELAGLISIFAPDKEDKIIPMTSLDNKNFNKKVEDVISLAQYIKGLEIEKLQESNIRINNSCLQFVKMWAKVCDSENNSEIWSEIVNGAISNHAVKTEGDFLKKINYTTNILKQIQKIAPTPYIREIASKAIKMLQKSPVNDILLYELDYKEKNE